MSKPKINLVILQTRYSQYVWLELDNGKLIRRKIIFDYSFQPVIETFTYNCKKYILDFNIAEYNSFEHYHIYSELEPNRIVPFKLSEELTNIDINKKIEKLKSQKL